MAYINGTISTVAFNNVYDPEAEFTYRALYPSELSRLEDLGALATQLRTVETNENNILNMRIRDIVNKWSQTSIETLTDLSEIDYDFQNRPVVNIINDIISSITLKHRIMFTGMTLCLIALVLYFLDISG
jgi:hypothetical protein